MKVGIIAATGKTGKLILEEALNHHLEVTAIVRHASKVIDNVPILEKDAFALTRDDLTQFDVVVNAFAAPMDATDQHIELGRHLIQALEGTNTRLIVVGGAGSLYTDDSKTKKVLETSMVPEFALPIAKAQNQNLEDIQASSNLKWTFISPSAFYDADGARTGNYRVGQNVVLMNSDGESYVSYPDYAIAVVREIQNADFVNQHITVVSEKA